MTRMFDLPDFPYDYAALEPHIDARTMEIHHQKHHATYVANLNKAIKGTEKEELSMEELLAKHADEGAIRNNGGGHWNHSFFWKSLSPASGTCSEEFLDAVNTCFGSMEEFQASFKQAALARFGSGWAWLCGRGNDLKICSTANQDNPLMPHKLTGCCSSKEGYTPVLGLDVWEHAYYLNYQNRRADYVDAFFKIVDWEVVSDRFREV